jgi:2-octaprenyl-6-methoxyphenol hydroxylase
MSEMPTTFDIVIVGGGPVGAALALGLRASPYKVALLEAQAGDVLRDDARRLALSHGSRLTLDRLGVWQRLPVTPIQRITVSQQNAFGRVELSAEEACVPALGYVAGYAALQQALAGALANSSVQVVSGCIARAVDSDSRSATVQAERAGTPLELAARLVVVADGAARLQLAHVKTRNYDQVAVVCELKSERPHRNRAFERFTRAGPIALLPCAHGWALVWTADADRASELSAISDSAFCAQLASALGARAEFGEFFAPGRRQVFPLVLKYATRPAASRTILIGNAAQTLHPVAGQGFNLGLRDAYELARLLIADAGDPGSREVLNSFFTQRRLDRFATILFTDSLIRLFSKDIPLFAPLRGAALAALSGFAPAKNFLARRMMFGLRG